MAREIGDRKHARQEPRAAMLLPSLQYVPCKPHLSVPPPVFSHDGRMVYAIQSDNKTVMSTTFNPATGELGANSSLPIPIGSTIFAW
jgi:hypothetical protein